jgi:CheY-like chemotaxis protein
MSDSAATDCYVLVVEDDDAIREVVAETLTDEGYRVSVAGHGVEALEKMRATDALPGLILLDLMMPVMDGRTFRDEQLKDPRVAGVPVVLMTADARATEMASELAASGVLRKPVALRDLFAAVERYCGKGTPT